MNQDIKCPYCGTPALKDIHITFNSGYFYGRHKCRRCKKIFDITIKSDGKSLVV